MLYFPNVRIFNSIEMPIANGYGVSEEGQALVANLSSGTLAVAPSAGVAGEIFVGVSIAQQLTPNYLPDVQVQVPSNNQIILLGTPLAGSLLVQDLTTGTTLTLSTTAPATGQYQLTANVLTVNSAQGNDTISVAYRYSPTTQQVYMIQGMNPAGNSSSLLLNSTGVIITGMIYTTEFDTSIDWTQSTPINLGANGIFTSGGSGVVVPAYVANIPSSSLPYLGLMINAVPTV